MVSRRSRRLFSKLQQPQMVLSLEVMEMIVEIYVDEFWASDVSPVKILPLLTSCKILHTLTLKPLYTQPILRTRSQQLSFLAHPCPTSFRHLKQLTLLTGDSPSLSEKDTQRALATLKRNVGRVLGDRYGPVGGDVGITKEGLLGVSPRLEVYNGSYLVCTLVRLFTIKHLVLGALPFYSDTYPSLDNLTTIDFTINTSYLEWLYKLSECPTNALEMIHVRLSDLPIEQQYNQLEAAEDAMEDLSTVIKRAAALRKVLVYPPGWDVHVFCGEGDGEVVPFHPRVELVRTCTGTCQSVEERSFWWLGLREVFVKQPSISI